MDLPTVVSLLVAYLAGSVLFGVHVSRLFGVTIYDEGSGNPGTSNVMRVLGFKAAALVLIGDTVKGLAPTVLGETWAGGDVGFACALVAALGHAFPLFHRFRGGKGVAVAGGGILWLAPVVGAALLVGWVAIVIATKTASLASLAVAVALVPAMALAGADAAELLWSAAIAVLILIRHAGNIARLLRAREPQVTEP